jgi:hypothetical protein
MVLDVIHNAGYGTIIRGTDCGMEQIYNFPLISKNPTFYTTQVVGWLNLHKSHLANGDVGAFYTEADGHINYNGASPVDEGSHDWRTDYNALWQQLPLTVKKWGTANGLSLLCHTSVNGTSISNASYDGRTFNVSGADQLQNQDAINAQGGMIIDWYNYGNAPTDEAGYISWYKESLDFFSRLHSGNSIFVQEWGDTRGDKGGVIQKNDPGLSANLADQVFFPYLKSGKMFGINFWNLFDTPQEGILSAGGNDIMYLNGGGAVMLNQKGILLASIFKKWFGGLTPTPVPTPVPTPTPIPTGITVSSEGVPVGSPHYHDLIFNGKVLGKIIIYY